MIRRRVNCDVVYLSQGVGVTDLTAFVTGMARLAVHVLEDYLIVLSARCTLVVHVTGTEIVISNQSLLCNIVKQSD